MQQGIPKKKVFIKYEKKMGGFNGKERRIHKIGAFFLSSTLSFPPALLKRKRERRGNESE